MKVLLALTLLGVALNVFVLNFSLGVFDNFLLPQPTGESQKFVFERQVEADGMLEEPEKEVALPIPLRVFEPPIPSAVLSAEGVFQWTNFQRQENQLSPLLGSVFLDKIAAAKVEDMFARQYFAHVSPERVGIGELAERVGYEFIAIGENLALGNYASDQALVQAWMDSPGHRANILGAQYDEIGIALRQGMFPAQSAQGGLGGEETMTWLAVQVFARPLSACDAPSESLRAFIELKKTQIEELELRIDQKRQEIEAHRPKFGSSYNQKAAEYNALAEQYNVLAASLQADIAAYNLQARAFNDCAKR